MQLKPMFSRQRFLLKSFPFVLLLSVYQDFYFLPLSNANMVLFLYELLWSHRVEKTNIFYSGLEIPEYLRIVQKTSINKFRAHSFV